MDKDEFKQFNRELNAEPNARTAPMSRGVPQLMQLLAKQKGR